MAHIAPSHQSISEDDAFIADALERASVPTLMMSMVHLSGDPSLLRGSIRPGIAMLGDTQGFMSQEDQTEIRARALELLKTYRDSGGELPPPPSAETIHEMMSFMVGQEVPDEYVPMMMEELALDGEDSRHIDWHDAVPVEQRESHHVLVIGAGMSGILAAIRLAEAEIPFTVVEKNEGVGGTWFENTYPGCRVDVANHFYCYSFEPNYEWSQYYSQQDELRRYFDRTTDAHGLRDRIRFNTEVVAARFDETSRLWDVTLRTPEGPGETLSVNTIVSAVGQLNRPMIPELPGLDCFAGPVFHSAEWRHDVDLEGKRVAVIGTGASALQLVPEVAKQASKLSVFQRTAA